MLYLRGDATGASPAAADLLNRHEADHRVLLTALSLGVLASDEGHEGVAQRAARLLSRVHRVNQVGAMTWVSAAARSSFVPLWLCFFLFFCLAFVQ